MNGATGSVEVAMSDTPQGALRATIHVPDVAALPVIVRRIRRVFDLSADPIVIGKQLAADPWLAQLVRKQPGLRVPGHWDDTPDGDDGAASYDAFDPTSGLRAAVARLSGRATISPRELRERAERWRPWRAYAVAQLLAASSTARMPTPAGRKQRSPGTTRRLARAG